MSYRTLYMYAIACACALVCALLSASAMVAPTMATTFVSVPAGQASATVTLPRASCPNEDEPGWDWTTCGNGFRGIVDSWGNRRVVGACEFVYRRAHGMVWYTRSERMLGDSHARKVCGYMPRSLADAKRGDR